MDDLLTTREVGKLLQVSDDYVLKHFGTRPGVIDIGAPEDFAKRKRRYRVLRIPRSVYKQFLTDNRIT